MEVWKKIKGFENYEISTLGNVKSLGNSFKRREKILKASVDSNGYHSVCLFEKGKGKFFQVHQIVAIVFLNHKPNSRCIVVDHINNIKTDNRLENLQIISQRENASKDKKGAISKHIGVYLHKPNGKWFSRISILGKTKCLGYFTNEIDASNAYKKALYNYEKLGIIPLKYQHSNTYRGVSWSKSNKKWSARMTINGKRKCLGHFTTELDASNAYENKLKELQLLK